MLSLHDVAYARIGCSDVQASVRFAVEEVGLELVREEEGRFYVRSSDVDHELVFFQGDPHDHVMAFEVDDDAALARAVEVLRDNRFEVTVGSDALAAERRVAGLVQFADPSGNRIELVSRPHVSGVRCRLSRDAGIESFSHVGLNSRDPASDERFWTEIGGARVSDRIGDAPLLRIDPVHHKIALFPAPRPGIQHLNFQVDSIDDVMRAWYRLRDRVPIAFGPGRHATSGAMFLYFRGPDGLIYEYSHGVRIIDDEARYRPRQFPAIPSSFCVWGAVPDIAEFR